MSANVHAIGMIAVLVLTGILLRILGEKPKGVKRILAGIVFGVFLAFISIAASVHSCSNGQPFLQWLIPSICSALLIIFIKKRWAGILLAGLMVISSLALSLQYSILVHSDRYIGVPEFNIPTDDGHDVRRIDTVRLWHTSFSGLYSIQQLKDES